MKLVLAVILFLFGAWVIGQLGAAPEERFQRDLAEYSRLTEQSQVRKARIELLEECIRNHRASDADCKAARYER